MMNEKTYHLINEYLNGELKGRALDKFKADLKVDQELQEAVNLQSAIIQSIQDAREKELKANLKASLNQGSTIQLTPRLRAVLSTAAAITLLVSAFFAFQQYNNSESVMAVEETAEDSTEDNSEFGLSKSEESNETGSDSLAETQILEKAITMEDSKQDLLDAEWTTTPPPPELEVVEDDLESDEELTFDLDVAADADGIEDTYNGYTNTDDFEVRTDQMLSNKTYAVNSIQFNSYTFTNIEESEDVVTATKPARNFGDRRRKDQSGSYKTAMPDSVGVEADKEIEEKTDNVVKNRNIEVEYWKSVVNYKGYNYDGNTVKLYGVDEATELTFKELDDRLYVEVQGKQYYIENNDSYNRLIEVVNPTLLNVLNEE